VVTYPYIAALVGEIAKDRVDVTTLAKGDEDPHFVVPRPSFIGKLRQADLLIINGASLEIGFVPPLIRQANNPKIMPGAEGFIDLSQFVELIEKPDRSAAQRATSIPKETHTSSPTGTMSRGWRGPSPMRWRAPTGAVPARTRRTSTHSWRGGRRSPMRGTRRPRRCEARPSSSTTACSTTSPGEPGMKIVGELEPKPGIPPTSRHLEELIEANAAGTVYMVVTDPYHERKSPEGLAKKLSVPWAVLPQDVAAVPAAKDIFSLYDTLLASVLK
jgi:zinc/manganese transport system substrate-binding protein